MDIDDLKSKIKGAIYKLYHRDEYLFINDLNERSLTSKLAQYLEEENFGSGYFVDHEYNKAYSSKGHVGTKKLTSEHGNSVDIVITKRDNDPDNCLVCFEVKRINQLRDLEAKKDRDKLMVLSGLKLPHKFGTTKIIKDKDENYSRFDYDFACYIILGKEKEQTTIEIYQLGHEVKKFDYAELS